MFSRPSTPVVPVRVRVFAVEDDATAKDSAPPGDVTDAVTPVRPASAVFNSDSRETWPTPLPNVIVWFAPPLTATVRVEEPAVPPAVTIWSSMLVELMVRLATGLVVRPAANDAALALTWISPSQMDAVR